LIKGFYGNAIVLTDQEFKNSTARTVPELVSKYLGIVKFSSGTGSNIDWALNWRGFNEGQGIVVIIDGIKVNAADQNDVYWSNINLKDIEKIEILPGAQSAQFGAGAFAGIINIITKKSSENSLELSSGSYGFGEQDLVLADTFGNFYYNFNYNHRGETGYRKKSNYDVNLGSIKFGWLSKNSELNIYHKSAQANMNYPDQLTEEEMSADRSQASNNPDKRNVEDYLSNLEYINKLNKDCSFSLNLGEKYRNVRYTSDSRTGTDTYTKNNEKTNSYLAQINFKNSIIIGYDYRLAQINSRSFGYDTAENTILAKTTDDTATKGEYAPYIQLLVKTGQFGLRYNAREDYTDYANTDINSLRNTKAFSKRTHGGEINYRFQNGLLGYISYGEAFKAPTFYDLFYNAWGTNNPDLNPELAKTTEAGFRLNHQTYAIAWNIFSVLVDDEIIYDNPSGKNQNMNKTIRNGFNLSGQKAINPNLNIFANYNYTKARVYEGQEAGAWPNNDNLDGYAIPLVPEQKYSIGIDYLLNKWTYNFSFNFVDSQYSVGDTKNEQPIQPAYNYSDLKITYQPLEALLTYLEINNIFNNIYMTRSLNYGTPYFMPADLRSGKIGFKWLF
jgi:outer membrane cobalamin receptor